MPEAITRHTLVYLQFEGETSLLPDVLSRGTAALRILDATYTNTYRQ